MYVIEEQELYEFFIYLTINALLHQTDDGHIEQATSCSWQNLRDADNRTLDPILFSKSS